MIQCVVVGDLNYPPQADVFGRLVSFARSVGQKQLPDASITGLRSLPKLSWTST